MEQANEVSKTMKQLAAEEKQKADEKKRQEDARKAQQAKAAAREPELASFYASTGSSVPWGEGPSLGEVYGVKYDCPLAAGKRLFAAGSVAAATGAYQQAVELNENDGEAWRMLGRCHAENDDDVKAIQAFERAAKVDPTNRAALVSLAVSLTNEQKTEEAVTTLRKWIVHHPRLSELHSEAKPAEAAPAESTEKEAEGSPEVPSSDFSAAETFSGAREGWYFGTSGNGVGYCKAVMLSRFVALSVSLTRKASPFCRQAVRDEGRTATALSDGGSGRPLHPRRQDCPGRAGALHHPRCALCHKERLRGRSV